MCLSCLSDHPPFGLDLLALTDLPPLRCVDRVRFDHFCGLLDHMKLLFGVWRQLVAIAIDFKSPMLDLSKNMDLVFGIDITSHGFEKLFLFVVQIKALVDRKRRGHPVDIFRRRHFAQSGTKQSDTIDSSLGDSLILIAVARSPLTRDDGFRRWCGQEPKSNADFLFQDL